MNIPEYNRVTADDSLMVKRAKQESQQQEYLSHRYTSYGMQIAHNYDGTSFFNGGFSTVNEHGGEIIQLPTGAIFYPQATAQNILQREIKTDRLGNIQNLAVPEYNRITNEDSLVVRRAKYQTQIRQLRSVQQENESATSRQPIANISQSGGQMEIPRPNASQIETNARISVRLNELRRSSRKTGVSSLYAAYTNLLSSAAQTTNQDIANLAVEAPRISTDNRKNFLQKGAESVNNFFYRLFNPRKGSAQNESRQYHDVQQQSLGQNSPQKLNQSFALSPAVEYVQNLRNAALRKNLRNGDVSRTRINDFYSNVNSGQSRGNVSQSASVAGASTSTDKRKNFLQKGTEAVNNFFYRIFHPRKYKAQREIQQRNYQVDGLGNIIGLNISPDNHIDGTDTLAVQQAKQAAQRREYVNQRGRLAPVYSTSTTVADREAQLREIQTNNIAPIVSERAAFFNTPSVPTQTFTNNRINRAQEIRSRVQHDSQALSRITGKPAPEMGADLTEVSSDDSLIQLIAQNPFKGASKTTLNTNNTSKNSLLKGVESVSSYLYKIFQTRKYRKQRSARSIQNNVNKNIFRRSENSATALSDTSIFSDITGGSFVSTKPKSNILEDIVNIWQQSKKNRLLSYDKIWNPILHYGGMLNFEPTSDGLFNFEGTPFASDFGDLPMPSLDFAQMAKNFTQNNGGSSSATTNNSNSSSTNNFNFGDVNINNNADFEEFVHKLKTLLNQGASNYGGR